MAMSVPYRSKQKGVYHPRRDNGQRRVSESQFQAMTVGVIAIMLSMGSAVFGQFLITPMKLDNIAISPGKAMVKPMKIYNSTNRVIDNLDFVVTDAVQDANGTWTPIAADDPNVDRSKLRSCASWISLNKDTLRLSPVQEASLNLTVRVPPQTQGHYCAALCATAAFPPGTFEGPATSIMMRYVVPIVVEAQGRLMRNEVSLSDVALEFRRETYKLPAATMAFLGIENKGTTYCRLQGYVRVSHLWGGHWRRITECEYSDVGIIPGAKLRLQQDTGQPLTAGRYKLEGFLVVNGQRADQVMKEIDFPGDPRAPQANRQTSALDFDPRELVIDTTPGSVRVSRIEVVNPSQETVSVDVSLSLPEHFNALTTQDPNTGRTIQGEEYGCHKWLTIEPKHFSLSGYGRQTLVVKADTPSTATGLPNYFAVVDLAAKFPDGQTGGTAKGRICLQMKKAQGAPLLDAKLISVSELSPAKYSVLARVTNNGTAQVLPTCHGTVATVDGQEIRLQFDMTSDKYNQLGRQLPMETRNFTGVLDVAGLAVGQYVLDIVLGGEKMETTESQRSLTIAQTNGVKTASIGGLDALGGHKIKIKGNL
jgi:hypothetical protein